MRPYAERLVISLAVLNILLQAFDGGATYIGLRAGFSEANPLVAWAIASLGAAPGLLLLKLAACAGVLTLWRLRRNRLAAPGLAFTAAIYVAGSLGPWTAMLTRIQWDM
jgi:uncharacterized membrane protein